MYTTIYLQETLLNLFILIELSLSNPHKNTLAELIVLLLENNKAHICKLGETLSINNSSAMACIQRIRRFLSNVQISPSIVLIPLINLMRPLLEKMPEIVLVMDGTDWKKRLKYINILSVAVNYKGRAIPLFWIVTGKKGSSSFEVWKRVLAPAIEALKKTEWLSGKPIHLLADREFASPKLAEWLKTSYNVESTLRIKASMYLKGEDSPEIKVATLIQKMIQGSRQVLYNQVLTRSSTFKMNVLLTWGKEYDEPLVVATTSKNPIQADLMYGKRFSIEPMHKDWKTNAFELEKTRVTDPKRIETLLIPIAFAYILCVLAGEQKEELGEVRKPPKGKTRMVGLFLEGIRTISKNIIHASIRNFKDFTFNLILPFCKAWDIHPSDVLPV